ncbi:lysophospholipid transporter LplT [Methyloradius palustris]|uniref:Lysophospholipid transporter LplT n=1 Tax=Methyloradius palustris TaxID=2778876 RepID=A0A8E4BUJ7_9PROT|nr:lysophospholipid transporter LplT [Methyloradius palustris]BCM26272.1 lysophospholipid transporter LplT [Methyloradius palustris]
MAHQPITSNHADKHGGLLSRGMVAVLIAQFISALADNALLFAAIALLKTHLAPAWQIPLLQEFFVVAFIILAPFVGPFADALPKGRVMLIANGLKFIGAAAMLSGLHPLLAYGMVGIGAAAYSPAKYGILSELVSAEKLVQANSMIEGSTIVAILLGAVVGGMLADHSATGALTAIAGCYLLAAAANLLIPRLKPMHPLAKFAVVPLLKDFIHALKTLFSNKDARFSLVGTSVFWGAGSTLRFLLVAWVPVALNIHDLSTPANLSGAVAIGIAFGAFAAAKYVNLGNVNRALPAGILIGLLIMAFAYVTNLYVAIALLIVIGACGGFYVVPLNALLQERGHESVGAGHAIAIQNLVENFLMLLMIGFYTLLDKEGTPVVASTVAVGALVFLAISTLAWTRLRHSK